MSQGLLPAVVKLLQVLTLVWRQYVSLADLLFLLVNINEIFRYKLSYHNYKIIL